jgi:hypothetical protein
MFVAGLPLRVPSWATLKHDPVTLSEKNLMVFPPEREFRISVPSAEAFWAKRSGSSGLTALTNAEQGEWKRENMLVGT